MAEQKEITLNEIPAVKDIDRTSYWKESWRAAIAQRLSTYHSNRGDTRYLLIDPPHRDVRDEMVIELESKGYSIVEAEGYGLSVWKISW